MDIKKWLEDGTKFKWKELRYLKTPALPYYIFIDDTTYRGADKLNNIIEHDITLEMYSETIDATGEETIEMFLDSEEISYEKSREWLQTEEMYVTVYSLENLLEKVRKEI